MSRVALVNRGLPDAVDIRRFEPGDADAVSRLVSQVFDQHVAPSFEPEGIAEMHRHISAAAIAGRAATHATFVAWQGALPAGVIEVRDLTHVSMLFVRTSHMGLGIATALVLRAEEACRAAGLGRMTVHSSVNAQSFYERLGFRATHPPQQVQGFRFVPMEKRIMTEKSIFTQAVHAGERGERPDFTPVSTPIYHSVGYLYDDMADLDRVFGGTRPGYVYTRYGSPTVQAFERAMATLETAEDAVAFSSGMAAVHAALLSAGARSGSNVVAAGDVYGATYALLDRLLTEMGVCSRFVDVTNLAEVQAAVDQMAPVALLCETVSNPLIKVANVPALVDMAHRAGAAMIVDNTFATPYLYRPLRHGADYVVHSATKYLGGHGDVMAGVVACDAPRARDLRDRQKLLGANLGPQEAWLALRGLKTLPLRLRQHCANAQAVAQWLAGRSDVARVNYPGLPAHPEHQLAARLFEGRGFGGMLSFELAGAGQAEVFAFMEALELVLPATTLGDVYSLTLYPAHSSHRQVGPQVRQELGIGDGLVRVSVGIEEADDIIADLAQALDRVRQPSQEE